MSVNSFDFLRRQIYFLLAAVHFSYLQVKCCNFLSDLYTFLSLAGQKNMLMSEREQRS
jgi:hypothetical protein